MLNLRNSLTQAGYDRDKIDFIVNGFKNGFSLNYTGPSDVRYTAPNLPFVVGDEVDMRNKVMKEVKAQSYAGPYEAPPFEHFIQSPIGLVPKDHGTKTQLIFHLSYPITLTSR